MEASSVIVVMAVRGCFILNCFPAETWLLDPKKSINGWKRMRIVLKPKVNCLPSSILTEPVIPVSVFHLTAGNSQKAKTDGLISGVVEDIKVYLTAPRYSPWLGKSAWKSWMSLWVRVYWTQEFIQ